MYTPEKDAISKFNVAIKSCWASAHPTAPLIRDANIDKIDDDSGNIMNFTSTLLKDTSYEILKFYDNFCPAFNWVGPRISREQPLSWGAMNPELRKSSMSIFLRQFMFSGYDTMYYHCEVS